LSSTTTFTSLISDIVAEFERVYWAPDGLARLDPEDKHPPFIGVLPSVANENGILFLSEILLELHIKKFDISIWRDKVRNTLKLLKAYPGVYDRRPGDKNLMNSHDNVIGIIVICQLFNFKEELEEMYKHGITHFWCFNNLDRKSFFDFRAWLQPRDQALLRMALDKFPGVISTLWLLGAIFTRSKQKRMMRLRMESVKMSNPIGLIAFFLSLWFHLWGGYPRFAKECMEYYKDPGQPYRRLLLLYSTRL
jgi:hypothetical protein